MPIEANRSWPGTTRPTGTLTPNAAQHDDAGQGSLFSQGIQVFVGTGLGIGLGDHTEVWDDSSLSYVPDCISHGGRELQGCMLS